MVVPFVWQLVTFCKTDEWLFVHGISSPLFTRDLDVSQICGSNSELDGPGWVIGQDKGQGKGSTPDRVYQLLGFVTSVKLSVTTQIAGREDTEDGELDMYVTLEQTVGSVIRNTISATIDKPRRQQVRQDVGGHTQSYTAHG